MKRLCLLLLLLALLTACKAPSTLETTIPTEASTSEATTEPTTVPTTQTEATTEETEPPTQAAAPQYYVQGDFSAYSEKETLTPLFTRPSEGSSNTLVALSKPATLFPFRGSILRDNGSIQNYLQGFIDSTGKIIVEPIYSTISYLTDYVNEITSPFWLLEQTTEARTEGGWPISKYGLISLDGTFVLDCKYESIELVGDRIRCHSFTSDSLATSDFEFYDLAGNLCLSSQDFPIAKDRLYSNYIEYGEDLYVVCLKLPPEKQAPGLSDHGYYYMTEDGEILYGPFADAGIFSHGLAVVTLPDESQTYLRKDGTLFSQRYDSAGYFFDGRASVQTIQGDWLSINTDGEILDTPCPRWLPDGTYCTQDYSDDGTTPVYNCYDAEGNLLWTRPCQSILSSTFCTWYDEVREGNILENPLTGKQICLPSPSYIEYTHAPNAPYVRVYIYPINRPYQERIITSQLETFAVIESPKDGSTSVSFVANGLKYEPCFALRKGNEVTLYRSPQDPVGTYSIGDFHCAYIFEDGTVSFTTDLCTEFYDPDGNLFFRYLINPMDD